MISWKQGGLIRKIVKINKQNKQTNTAQTKKGECWLGEQKLTQNNHIKIKSHQNTYQKEYYNSMNEKKKIKGS